MLRNTGKQGLRIPFKSVQNKMQPMYIKRAYEKAGKSVPGSGGGGGGGGSGGGSSQPGTGDTSQSSPVSDWAAMLTPAKNAVRDGVISWASMATLTSGQVMAMAASGGKLDSNVNFQPTIKEALQSAGATDDVAENFAVEMWSMFRGWYSGYSIIAPAWYPAFVAWPGPQAPATANVPTPLGASGLSNGTAKLISSAQMTSRFTNALGSSVMSQSGAENFVSQFSSAFALAFSSWLVTSQWLNVFGSGPVPTWAPPYVPVGPVVGGTFFGLPGCLSGDIFPLW